MISASGVPLPSGTWGLPGPALMVSGQALGFRDWHLGGPLPFTYVTREAFDQPIGELAALRIEHRSTSPRTLSLCQ